MEAPLSRYRKIEVRTWSDEKFRALTPIPPCGQGLWFYLLTGPHTGPIPGLFRAGRAGLAEELGWDLRAFDKAFREISDRGMAKADFQAKLVWVPNALRHNPPASPNVVKPWGKEFDLLPESPLKLEALGFMKAFIEDMSEAFREAFRSSFRKLDAKAHRKSSGNQEQEQDIVPSQEGLVRLGTTGSGSSSVRDFTTGRGSGSVDDGGGGPDFRDDDLDDDLDGEAAHAA